MEQKDLEEEKLYRAMGRLKRGVGAGSKTSSIARIPLRGTSLVLYDL
ncbi:hypothetical protein MPNT_80095 [Candidatus Methylacidithermus pantelleriae]|uniref:Uncharacterized protein n=1 Tax=Candidatus Methylacidithermus pantelleriae TaxID=2744239 RepID=A0A8J2BW12_9BACT|nr:hypothetical protein MPNT_80095 [Candidatus Methylacidithermus pantelleriae]